MGSDASAMYWKKAWNTPTLMPPEMTSAPAPRPMHTCARRITKRTMGPTALVRKSACALARMYSSASAPTSSSVVRSRPKAFTTARPL
jgi:hypothetical protein